MDAIKVGDKCIIVGHLMPHRLDIGDEVEVFRQITDNIFDVCRKKNGDCDWVAIYDLQLIKNKKEDMKAMKQACLQVAKDLAKANNTITTLEIKLELRRDYPYYYWDQSTVSSYMDQFAGDGLFTYKDAGTYRIYSLASPKTIASTTGPVTKTVGTITKKVVNKTFKGAGKFKSLKRSQVLSMVTGSNFESVTLSNGKVVTASDIKGQKKSPSGYIAPKVNTIQGITVGGLFYTAK
jgi:hypothetical protein